LPNIFARTRAYGARPKRTKWQMGFATGTTSARLYSLSPIPFDECCKIRRYSSVVILFGFNDIATISRARLAYSHLHRAHTHTHSTCTCPSYLVKTSVWRQRHAVFISIVTKKKCIHLLNVLRYILSHHFLLKPEDCSVI